jgi:hypothetical protein
MANKGEPRLVGLERDPSDGRAEGSDIGPATWLSGLRSL